MKALIQQFGSLRKLTKALTIDEMLKGPMSEAKIRKLEGKLYDLSFTIKNWERNMHWPEKDRAELTAMGLLVRDRWRGRPLQDASAELARLLGDHLRTLKREKATKKKAYESFKAGVLGKALMTPPVKTQTRAKLRSSGPDPSA